MSTRTFAMLFGIVFLAIGVLGFVPALVEPLHPGHPEVNPDGGLLLGLFPINAIHNAVHILFGLWGLAASRSLGGSLGYARAVAVIYIVLAVMGLLAEPFNTTFGFIPLYQNDVWLHGAIGLVAAYFGWVHRNPANA